MIRVLVAEDSSSARAMLVKILAADRDIQVVGQAKDGVEAIEMTRKLRPDLVTMDIQMPLMGGLEATQEIMITAPTPIVIVTSSTRAREVAESLDTLHVGALDVLAKPSMPGTEAFAEESKHLVSVVRSLSKVRVGRLKPPGPTRDDRLSLGPRTGESRRSVVAIAASAGGPLALHRILGLLPADLPTPILVSQHVTPGFTPGLASWLDAVSQLRVKVAEEGEILVGRTVYLAPDGIHLGVSKQGTVALSVAPPMAGFRPSGSYLFDSVARAYKAEALAIVLTGEGADGVEGLRAIRESGGRVIAQDESSSVVFGMPDAAIAAGLADEVLSLDTIAARIAGFE